MSLFPTTSSVVFELQPHQYDLRQLINVVRGALKDRKGERPSGDDDSGATPAAQSLSPPPEDETKLFHLHTLTIDCTLLPPPFYEVHYYHGEDRNRPNPAYLAYEELRDQVRESTPAMEPITFLPPTQHLLHLNLSSLPGTRIWPPTHLHAYLPTSHRTKPFLNLPELPSHAAKEWLPNSKAKDLSHALSAALALDPDEPSTRKGGYRDEKRRFEIDTSMHFTWVPIDDGPRGPVELKVILNVDFKMDIEAVTQPLPDIGQDMLGLVLHSFFPAKTPYRPMSESEARATALRSFFGCMQAAPDHDITFDTRVLQPKEMVSKLLPFQARTLALLLRREKSSMVKKDDASSNEPQGLWTVYDLGPTKDRLAYRRTTGDLMLLEAGSKVSDRKGKRKAIEDVTDEAGLKGEEKDRLPQLLDLSGVAGTMLCEEMGLGKTVEALALTMLHRHPLSRARQSIKQESPESGPSTGNSTPATKLRLSDSPIIDLSRPPPGLGPEDDDELFRQWANAERAAFDGHFEHDDQAQLNVAEVATTLIVTPPSLLKQWVAEMRKHAPSLRVCVYEGWKSLQKGIEKEHAATVKRSLKSTERKKRRASEKLVRKTSRKYAKKNGGGRGKRQSDINEMSSDSESEEEVQEESSLEICQRRFVEYVRLHDVVVTTYNDLSADLKVALPAPARSRRSNAKYKLGERPRSPLVMVEWWRVIMDEVQLHGDQTDAANMVSLIPRKFSLAVSGTPAKADVKDLMGSLKFLRVPVIPHDHRLWHRLQQVPNRPAFEGLFRCLAVRTTKKEVAGEFRLPSQNRFVVPIELSEIELHYYNDTLDRQRDLLRIPNDPAEPRAADWVFDRALFTSCLRTLRQICTHIQVGQMQGARGGDQRLHLGRQLMTMSEALDKMRTDHSQEFLVESRQQMRELVRKAQLTILNENDQVRHRNAQLIYEKIRERLHQQIGPVRDHLQTLLEERRQNREGSMDTDYEREDTPPRNQSQKDRERTLAIQSTRQSIREMLIIEHQTWFFEGDIWHVLKDMDKETLCYEQAEKIRQEVLSRPLKIANSSVGLMQKEMKAAKGIEKVDELRATKTDYKGGLLSNDTVTQANELLKILNGHAELLFNWRSKIIDLLSSAIESELEELLPGQTTEVDNPDKEYYAEALKSQGDVEAYLIAYAAVIADRKEFLLEERSLLAEHDGRIKKLRKTMAAKQAQEDTVEPLFEPLPPTDEVAEQAEVLMTERQVFRDARDIQDCKRPLKGLLIDLNGIAMGQNRAEEVTIAKSVAKELKTFVTIQSEIVDKLNKELDMFRKTFNRRVVYFAALQEISDSVSTPEFRDVVKDLAEASRKANELEAKLARMVIKGRFLSYLGTREQNKDELKEDCIICMGSSDDNQGILLGCGHFFCQSCFREFRRSGMGRRCPSCRTDINDREITKIKFAGIIADDSAVDKPAIEGVKVEDPEDGSQKPDGPLEAETSAEAERERRHADMDKLRFVERDRLREVAVMDMMGEYGSKINFLIKHLLWYRSCEPDARHVIFSNWSDSLNIVIRALQLNGISFVSFDQNSKKHDVVDRFIKDPSITVFLLHAERESSGLTLTSCRVVHLLEPVLKHSFELQAIGRVDRLGQDKETTVYCYATNETVESRILSQGVRNGTSIYLKDETADSVVASMPNYVSAAHKGGDLTHDGNEEELLKLIM